MSMNTMGFNNPPRLAKQAGFSLIELVIVIVILGILAATALPRFLDVTDEAKASQVEGVAGGFATGVSLARAQWEAEARPSVGGINTVLYDTVQVYLTTPNATQAANGTMAAGYPMSTSPVTEGSAAMTGALCLEVWDSILQNPARATATFSDVASQGDFYKYFVSATGGATASQCVFHQVNSLDKNASGDYTNPGTDTSVSNNFTYQPATGRVLTNLRTN